MGRKLRAAALFATAGTLLSVGPLGSAAHAAATNPGADKIRQLMFCRASAARVALNPSTVIEPTVANKKANPCVHEEKQLAVVPVGTLAAVEGLGADTQSQVRTGAKGQITGVTAGAEARVAHVFAFVPGLTIVASGVFSTAEESCDVVNGRLPVHTQSQSSRIARITIAGKTYTDLNKAQTINLGAIKVKLNQSPAPGVQQAISVELNGLPLVTVGEAAAGLLFPCGRQGGGDTGPR